MVEEQTLNLCDLIEAAEALSEVIEREVSDLKTLKKLARKNAVINCGSDARIIFSDCNILLGNKEYAASGVFYQRDKQTDWNLLTGIHKNYRGSSTKGGIWIQSDSIQLMWYVANKMRYGLCQSGKQFCREFEVECIPDLLGEIRLLRGCQ